MARLARMNFVERISTTSRTSDPVACWDWPGHCLNGYGTVSANIDARGWRKWLAHRAAYTVLVGPVDDALELDHLCRNRRCMNPRHLEPVTPRVNTMRSAAPTARNALKTHCVNGHAFTPDNTRRGTTKYGPSRHCKRCEYDTNRSRFNRVHRKRAPGPVTHCKHGHEFTPENTVARKTGGRTCLTCRRGRTRAWMAQQRTTEEGKRKQANAKRQSYQNRRAS